MSLGNANFPSDSILISQEKLTNQSVHRCALVRSVYGCHNRLYPRQVLRCRSAGAPRGSSVVSFRQCLARPVSNPDVSFPLQWFSHLPAARQAPTALGGGFPSPYVVYFAPRAWGELMSPRRARLRSANWRPRCRMPMMVRKMVAYSRSPLTSATGKCLAMARPAGRGWLRKRFTAWSWRTCQPRSCIGVLGRGPRRRRGGAAPWGGGIRA